MSFGRGGGRGRVGAPPGRGRGGGGRFGGGRGGGRGMDEGPPAEIVEIGSFMHSAESEMVCRLTLPSKIPYFNAGIYLENKAKIGKVEEVFGPVSKVYFTIKPDAGVNANSFQPDDKVYIGTDKLLPLERFTNESKGGGGGGRGSGRGGGRGAPSGRFSSPGRGGRGPPGRGPPGRGFGAGRGPPGRGFSGGRGSSPFAGRGGGRGRF